MIYTKVVLILLIALTSTCFGYNANVLNPASSALIKLENYDATVRPPGGLPQGDGPVNVTINMYVINIDKIDFMENSFQLHMYFRREWVDSRLAFSGPEQVVTSDVKPLWKPDLFFINEKCGHVHSITTPNTFVKLHSNGKVLLSTRFTLNFHCPMDLWKFPFDTQRCQLQIESYGYTTKDLNIDWKGKNPIDVAKDLNIPGFTLKGVETTQNTETVGSGNYKILKAYLQFKRNYATYIMRVFIPMFLLVIASWATFWLPASNVVARIAVGSITSLTSVLLINREEYILHLPVLTSFDIWVGVSAFYTFAAFFEYILVLYQESRKDQMGMVKNCDSGKSGKFLGIKMNSNENCTDTFSKIGFSISYVLFNLIFVCSLF